jgi:alkylation response protein AidB-like acyl-CoA dehydrogenase
MDCALEMTLEYLRTRVQFGKPIGSFQALQHRAVDMYIQKELTRATLAAAVALLDQADCTPERRSAVVSSAKARASQAALAICKEALQMHGAIGYTDEYDLGLYFNRALVLAAWLGNASAHRARYAALTQAT